MSTPANLLRVEKGHADPEELAAITAVLLARASAQPLPLFTPKFMVAWARWRAQPASRVRATISSYA
ncbi:acyl-CoA carboxylase subunit epsilon, partial [Streptomyces sp. NPDC055721]